jgi:cytochrome c-type biogenesis protein CcmF
MNYIGEHLLPGQIGHFLVVLSFVAALVATIAYARSVHATSLPDAASWKRLGRIAFVIDAVALFSVFGVIFYIVANHYFEYHYAWNHSDRSLESKYLLSSIWEGQEGSFLLWALWHAVLGVIVIKTSRKWEAPVMSVMSLAQVCVTTMFLGVYIFGLKIGNSPFLLTREVFPDNPVFSNANYLQLPAMQDGIGLNQLLQNYWMTIHPPITFLGYASTLVPFAFAIGGLWTKDFGGWTKPALPWALFSIAIFGLGIMMGAKWAYESLSFGGYWAWDPVENASLVPWLIMVAGLHTQLVYNSTGHSLRATYFFYLMGFVLVLYSTYLTRSGDLQDTSVHAFVSSGLNWQLRAFVLAFFIPAMVLFFKRYRKIPHIASEENTYSREFWMFIGSLVLFLAAIAIIIPTSYPLINKIIGTNFVIGDDVEFAYNRIQVFVAVVLGILTAVTQYFRYKDTPRALFGKRVLLPTVIAVLISVAIGIWGNVNYDKYGIGFLAAIHLALFAGIYAIVANAGYIWTGLNGKLKAAGGSVAHVGFGMMLVGILLSSAKKEILSINLNNPLNFGPESEIKGYENLTLYQGIRTDMGKYWVTYVSDSVVKGGKMTYFRIDMEEKQSGRQFTLYPDIIKATKGQEGYSNNPDAKHYWNKDIFIYVNAASSISEQKDTSGYKKYPVKIGDTLFYSAGYITFDSVTANPRNEKYQFKPTDTAIQANLTVTAKGVKTFQAKPVFYVANNQTRQVPDTVHSEGLELSLLRVVDNQRLEIGVKESTRLTPYIALKVLQFPFIYLVWIGTVIMIVGLIMSMVRRARLGKS